MCLPEKNIKSHLRRAKVVRAYHHFSFNFDSFFSTFLILLCRDFRTPPATVSFSLGCVKVNTCSGGVAARCCALPVALQWESLKVNGNRLGECKCQTTFVCGVG